MIFVGGFCEMGLFFRGSNVVTETANSPIYGIPVDDVTY